MFGCTVLALLASGAAHAQETYFPPILQPPPPDPPQADRPAPPPSDAPAALAPGPLVYTPADFLQYAPRSALDMLQQVPGFNIQESFGQGRGLGEATGNVLINGERISSKSDTVTQRLTRIPASSVVRIEFVDGATLDIPGLTGRVANIITAAGGSDISGQFEWNPQLATDYAKFRWSAARASVTGTRGAVRYTVALDNNPFYGGTGGPNAVIDRGIFEQRFSQTQSVSQNPRISTQLRIDGPGSSVGNFSALYQRSWMDGFEDEYVVVPSGVTPWLEEIDNENDGYNYEIGGDLEFRLGPGRLKLIGLESFRQSDFSTQAVTTRTPGARTGSRFSQNSESGERIARAEYKWKMAGGDWQLSGEAAFNRLHNTAGLQFLTPGGNFIDIPFPAGTGGVTEDRYESILSYGRALSSKLSLQASGGAEYSKISQTGSNALSRTFVRPKGSLSLAWAARPDLDVSLKITRRVGQLNFADFLADVNLSNNNVNSGNNELRPDQAWEIEIEAAKDLGAWGSVTVSAYHHRITDYVTVVPLPGGGESVGNIDEAEETGVSLTATIRLEPIGFRGAKFDIDAQVRKSSLLDPVTLDLRAFDRFQPRNFNIAFRHDVPDTNWAWGANFRSTDFEPYYRLSEVGLDYNLRDALGVFVENKDVFGLTVIARLNNILEENAALERTIYAGPRGSGAPALFSENRQREVGHIVNFTVRGSF